MIIQWFGFHWLGQNRGPSPIFVWRTGGAGGAIVDIDNDAAIRISLSAINTGGTKMTYGGAGGIM